MRCYVGRELCGRAWRDARVQRASNARHLGARRDRLPRAAGPFPIRSTKLELHLWRTVEDACPYKILRPPPAARVSKVAGDESKTFMFFSSYSLQSGTEREIQEGTSWRAMFAPAPRAMFATANKQTRDFGLPKSDFLVTSWDAPRSNIKNGTPSARSHISQAK